MNVGIVLMWAMGATVITPPRAISFDEAKKDESKRLAYLAQHLDPWVYDKQANPKGLVKAWYYTLDTQHLESGCHCMKCAQAALLAEYTAEKRQFFFQKELPGILAPLETPATSVLVFTRDGIRVGAKKHASIILVGELFKLQNEDEVKSLLEDYALTYLKTREEGLTVKDRELDSTVPAVGLVSKLLISHWSQSAELANIQNQTRKVSDGFRKELEKSYADTHGKVSRAYAKERKVYDDNNENTLQKEIVDFLEALWGTYEEQLGAMKLQAKVVNRDNYEYVLEPK
jgi:hypothetical protein